MAPPAALPGGCLECSPGSQGLEGDVKGRFPLNPAETPVFLLVSVWRRVGVFCCEATLFLALWLGTLAASWLFQLWGHRLPLGFSSLGAPTAPCPGWAGTVGTRGGSLPHPSSSLGPRAACLLLPTPFPGSCLEHFLRVAERARGEQSSCVSAELESASSWSFRAGFGLFLGDHSCA